MTRLGVTLLGVAGLVAAFATLPAQATPVCTVGPAVPGAQGPPTNGCTTTIVPVTGATSITALFVGFSAADSNSLFLQGANTLTGLNPSGLSPLPGPPALAGSTLIFTNQGQTDNSAVANAYKITGPGVVAGSPLNFTLKNNTTGNSFQAGVAYANTTPAFSPVYHFLFEQFASVADYNAVFPGVSLSSADLAFINANGGISAFTFAGVEDLLAASTADWNNLIYGFLNVCDTNCTPSSMPEPASLALLGSAFVGFGVFRWRRKTR
jgi:PEP-CTERM motif